MVLILLQLGSSFGSMPLSQKREVIVRWLVWVPFEKALPAVQDMTLELEGGPKGNPANPFCLSARPNQSNEVNEWAFTFFLVCNDGESPRAYSNSSTKEMLRKGRKVKWIEK